MNRHNVQIHEKTFELRYASVGTRKLGTVIRQNRIWQSKLLKSLDKAVFYSCSRSFWLNSNTKTRVVIQNCQRITADAVPKKKVTFEICLPHFIAMFFFEALESGVLCGLSRIN